MGFGSPVGMDMAIKVIISIGLYIFLPTVIAIVLFGGILKLRDGLFKPLVILVAVAGALLFFFYGMQRIFT